MNDKLSVGELFLRLKYSLFSFKDANCGYGHRAMSDFKSSQYLICYYIHYLNLSSLTKLSEALYLNSSSLSLTISKMEEMGLLKRNYDAKANDKRLVCIELTDEGIMFVTNLTQKICESLDKHINFLSDLQKELLKDSIILFNKIIYVVDSKNKNLDLLNAYTIFEKLILFMSFIKKFEKHFNKNGKSSFPISLSQFHILQYLNSPTKRYLNEMCSASDTSESSLSLLISKLEKLGYIEKNRCPSGDLRKKQLVITEKGKDILLFSEQEVLRQFDAFFVDLEEDAQNNLAICLVKLLALIDELTNISVEASLK